MAESRVVNAVKDADDSVPLDDLRQNLKKDIETECELILQRVRIINSAAVCRDFHVKFWENKVDEIRKAHLVSYDIEELKELRGQSITISQELEEFSKKLS